MLTTYLNNQPYSKFVLIEDYLHQPGKRILQYIINSHIKTSNCKIHYFVFERNFENTKRTFAHPSIECYDFVSNSRGWLDASKKQDFPTAVSQTLKNGGVLVIDSLLHAIFQYGTATIYKTLQQLLTDNNGLVQIITMLHLDLCENIQITDYFEHLSTLALTLEPKLNSDSGRVSYLYRKPGGKIIKKIEEYKFINGILKTEAIKIIDPKILVQENLTQVMPENLSTFRISLNEREKESRDKLVLPYLPKESADDNEQKEMKIFYQFDNIDDWDEEDPDDDLDI